MKSSSPNLKGWPQHDQKEMMPGGKSNLVPLGWKKPSPPTKATTRPNVLQVHRGGQDAPAHCIRQELKAMLNVRIMPSCWSAFKDESLGLDHEGDVKSMPKGQRLGSSLLAFVPERSVVDMGNP